MTSDVKPTANITLRAAHSSEAGAIASMSRLHVEYGLNWRWTTAKIRRHIKDKDTMVLVAGRDGLIAGFAVMRFGDRQAHLFLLAVQPGFRRMGIGRSMMRWLEKSCRTAGIQRVRLEVRASNRGARLFYWQLGYRYLGRLAGYYDGREAAVVMVRSMLGAKSSET